MPSNSAQTVPAALQMMMMRYWHAHGEPKQLPILRVDEHAEPVEIKLVGHEAFQVHGHMVRLSRYTVGGIGFGREILWMNDSNRLAAVMTFAAGLPQETVLDEYEEHFVQLEHSGVIQEMLDLADLDKQVPPEATGTFAIVGARLIDGTGAAPVENSTVLVRDGRIAAIGGSVPRGVRVIDAHGKSLLPGLWEMHSHYSGVEFGPALLAAGVTTTRDCGGEFEFLTTVRDEIAKHHALGPRILLAGLIDSGGPLGFGLIDVENPAQAIAAVDNYADHGFVQIKVYSQIKPDILRVIFRRGAQARPDRHRPRARCGHDGRGHRRRHGPDQPPWLREQSNAVERQDRRELRCGEVYDRPAEAAEHRRGRYAELDRDGEPSQGSRPGDV